MEASPDSGPTSVTKSQTVEKGEVRSIKLRYLSVRANDLSGSEKEPQVKGRPPTSGLCQHKIPGNTTGGKLGCLSVSYSKEVYNKTFMNSNTHGVTDWQPEQKQALARGVSHTCKCSNTRSMRWGAAEAIFSSFSLRGHLTRSVFKHICLWSIWGPRPCDLTCCVEQLSGPSQHCTDL